VECVLTLLQGLVAFVDECVDGSRGHNFTSHKPQSLSSHPINLRLFLPAHHHTRKFLDFVVMFVLHVFWALFVQNSFPLSQFLCTCTRQKRGNYS